MKIESSLDFNLKNAKAVCQHMYHVKKFQTLNKPTHCEMIFLPENEKNPNFQKVHPLFPNGVVMGLTPPDENWKGTPFSSQEMNKEIKKQIKQYSEDGDSVLFEKINFSNESLEGIYLKNLLTYRIVFTVLENYKAGNCGEWVAYATINLLLIRHKLKASFNLEVIQLDFPYPYNNNEPCAHVIGVIGRELKSDIDNPDTWGEASVVYDPWNMGQYFKAKEMRKRPYYKNNVWKEASKPISFNRPIPNQLSQQEEFNYFENYILETALEINSIDEYIGNANFILLNRSV